MSAFRLSLRYKLALPVAFLVLLILIILTHTTIRVVRDFVIEAFQAEILTEAETLSGKLETDFFRHDFTSLQRRLEEAAARPEVYGVQIVDREGLPILRAPLFRELPYLSSPTFGAKPVFSVYSLLRVLFRLETPLLEERLGAFPDLFVAAAPFSFGEMRWGGIQIFFTTQKVDATLREIYRDRIFFSFLAALGIAFLTAAVTWLAIHPLFRLTETVHDILKGHTEARAQVRSGDEIEDLARSFNEMLERLDWTLKRLKSHTEALEESEGKYRTLVESAADIIWMLSPEGKIIFMNRPFAGLGVETLLREGFPLFLSFHTEDSIQRFEAALKEVQERKTPVSHLTTIYHDPRTGTEIYYSTNLTPVLGRAKELRAIQAITRDVTELKRIEIMKEHLIRDVAHELKTPVAKFQMTLSVLEQDVKSEGKKSEREEVVQLMKRNADLLMNMITDIMNLSRLEAGTHELKREPCDLNRILTRVCEDIAPLAQEKKLVLEKELSPSPLILEGDETMLYRLFCNLGVNAVKFTTQGRITVKSEIKNGKARVRVQDTGEGIKPNDLERVFDRFYQRSPATSGMGIGLALAREIVLLHGGSIWAESPGLGQGSTFIVELPYES